MDISDLVAMDKGLLTHFTLSLQRCGRKGCGFISIVTRVSLVL